MSGPDIVADFTDDYAEQGHSRGVPSWFQIFVLGCASWVWLAAWSGVRKLVEESS